jgi:hypothetical protein
MGMEGKLDKEVLKLAGGVAQVVECLPSKHRT